MACRRGLSVYFETPKHKVLFDMGPDGTFLQNAALLFSDVGPSPVPISANQRLRRREEDAYPQDNLQHEQHLLATSCGMAVLLAGCAHGGVIPIMERCVSLLGRAPDVVLGDFHLYSPGSGETEPAESIQEIGRRLKAWPSTYYTGHCTGPSAFSQLKEILGDQLRPMSGGLELQIL